jgi:TrpR-related protein YerC/YecD
MRYQPTQSEKELFTVISSLQTEEETRSFLRDLLTEAEIKEFSNRWKVAQMLDKKIAYKEIEKATGMSSTTIARIQKWLTNGMNGYKNMLVKKNKTNSHHLPL